MFQILGDFLIIVAFFPHRLDTLIYFILVFLISVLVTIIRFKIKNNTVFIIVFVIFLSVLGFNKINPIINATFWTIHFCCFWLISKEYQ